MQGWHRVNPDLGSLWNRSVPCESEPSEEAVSRPGIVFYIENGRGGGLELLSHEGRVMGCPGQAVGLLAGLVSGARTLVSRGSRVVEGQTTPPPVSPAPRPSLWPFFQARH